MLKASYGWFRLEKVAIVKIEPIITEVIMAIMEHLIDLLVLQLNS